MNIKDLPSKIKYYELERLELHDFLNKALLHEYYSDLKFINYFKEEYHHVMFWQSIILFTTLPIELILTKYKKYFLMKDEFTTENFCKLLVYYEGWYPWNLDEETLQRAMKNVKQFIKIYNKNEHKKFAF